MSSAPEPETPDRRSIPIWHALTASEVLAELDSDPANGLGRAGDIHSARTAAVNLLVFGEPACVFAIRRFDPRKFWVGLCSGNRAALGAAATPILLELET